MKHVFFKFPRQSLRVPGQRNKTLKKSMCLTLQTFISDNINKCQIMLDPTSFILF